MRAAFKAALERSGIYEPNAFGVAALTAAYSRGEEWLEALLAYIGENLEFLAGFVDERLPGIRVIEPEATYLAWLDCRGLGMDRRELRRFMREKARVAFDEGYIFGSPEGDGFERVNMACPRSVLKEGLERIEKAIRG
jgi:cystathionine beta-lyase